MGDFFKHIGSGLVLTYKLFREVIQLVWGVWKVNKLPQPCVSVFGGTAVKEQDRYAGQAHYIASELVKNNISVLTGGGPGIMQAANCGAVGRQKKNEIRTMGITLKEFGLAEVNMCARESLLVFDYLFARKWLLINYSLGFVVFPGGVGTIDEFFELLTSIQTKQRAPGPIILIGSDFWRPLMEWVKEAGELNFIQPQTISLIIVTDDSDKAVKILKEHCDQCFPRAVKHKTP